MFLFCLPPYRKGCAKKTSHYFLLYFSICYQRNFQYRPDFGRQRRSSGLSTPEQFGGCSTQLSPRSGREGGRVCEEEYCQRGKGRADKHFIFVQLCQNKKWIFAILNNNTRANHPISRRFKSKKIVYYHTYTRFKQPKTPQSMTCPEKLDRLLLYAIQKLCTCDLACAMPLGE